MKGKAGLVVGMAAGYVLGARDGRGRYEQIKTQAERLWNDPQVQRKAAQAQDLAKQKAPLVTDKISQVADKAAGKATDATSSKGSDRGSDTGTKTPSAPGTGTVKSSTGTSTPSTPSTPRTPSTPSTPSAPKSVTPASAPVAKGPELHADPTPPTKPGGLHG